MFFDDQYLKFKKYLLELVPDMDEDTWLAFLEKTQIVEYNKGDHIYRTGDICRYISFVSEGVLRSYYLTDDGREVVTSFTARDNYYSDYQSFLAQEPTRSYTQALNNSVLINVSYNDLQGLYSKYPKCERVGRIVAENLFKALSNRNSSFQFETPQQRYIKFMVDHAKVAQMIPLYMIASYIGITPEALSRIRKRLQHKNKE